MAAGHLVVPGERHVVVRPPADGDRGLPLVEVHHVLPPARRRGRPRRRDRAARPRSGRGAARPARVSWPVSARAIPSLSVRSRRAGSSSGRSDTARSSRFTAGGMSPRARARRPDDPSRAAARAASSRLRSSAGRELGQVAAGPARGGSRGSPRTRRPAPPPRARASRRSARGRSARTSLRIPWYATSRTRMCSKLKVSSPANRAPSGWISCLRTSAPSWRSSSARSSPRSSSSTAPPPNDRPTTAAASTTARSAGIEPVEPGRQQSVEGGRHRDARPALGPPRPRPRPVSRWCSSTSMRTSSSTNSGLPSAPLKTRRERSAATPASPSRCSISAPLSAPLSGSSSILAAPGSLPGKVGPGVEQVGPGGGHDQDRDAPDRARQVLDQLEERRLAPVDVLEEDHERPPGGGRPRGACARPRRSPRGARRRPTARAPRPRAPRSWRCRRRPGSSRAIPACACSELSAVVDARELLDHLAQRPEREALAVGEAAAGDDGGRSAERVREVRRQPGLADPGRPQHGHQLAGRLGDRALEGVPEQRQLALAPHQR